MNKRTDQNYLRRYQYRDANNLNARIDLHRRFSTNPDDWFRWVFEHFNQSDDAVILEIGCGPGLLWKQNLERVSMNWCIHLTDFSPGMLQEAQEHLQGSSSNYILCNLDAQYIPYTANSFDLVIANHMLYHIPDRPRALSEIHRVLKPHGRFLAATNGIDHMIEMRELFARLYPTIANHNAYAFGVNEFTIDNGAPQLAKWFSNIQTVPFIDSLEVTEADPLVAYILSMSAISEKNVSAQDILLFRNYLESEIHTNGLYHITKSTALFIAENKP